MYSAAVIEHALDLARAGSAGAQAAWGEAGDAHCGDAVRIELAVADGGIVAARHRSFACPHATAAAALACRLAEGRDLLGAATIGAGELETVLRPEGSNRECVALAADALARRAGPRHRRRRGCRSAMTAWPWPCPAASTARWRC